MAQARDLSSMHAPVFGLRGCLNFFGQGSSTYGFRLFHFMIDFEKSASIIMKQENFENFLDPPPPPWKSVIDTYCMNSRCYLSIDSLTAGDAPMLFGSITKFPKPGCFSSTAWWYSEVILWANSTLVLPRWMVDRTTLATMLPGLQFSLKHKSRQK